MLVPSIFKDSFANNFFDDVLNFPFEQISTSRKNGMNVDIQEFDDKYQMDLELPGYQKEDIKADLNNGYLTVSADHTEEREEQDKDGTYIHRERSYGRCSRSFYVGENITQEDIHASFKNGILRLDIPKKELKPEVEEKQYITIEG